MRVPGSRLAIHEAQAPLHHVREGAHQRGMLLAHHEPCVRREHAISWCSLGLSNGFNARANTGAAPRSAGTWKPATRALAVVQGAQGVDAALKTEVEMQVGALGDVLLQYRQRQVVARAHRQQLVALIARVGEHARQIGAQRLDVRLHARSHAPLRPQQLQRKLRRTCTPVPATS